MNLVPLFEEALEFQDYNGSVLSNGKAAVYYIGRTRLADIYNDVAAEYPAENPRILDNLGMGPVYVSPAFDYELVVFDEYNNELFSVKKYLASKGEHSTANVVVTPSESIAVSAWTVGDVQVYMPYITGQLGKVYTGIDPVNVDNVNDTISVSHVGLGLQEPLYFVEDSETACIIGCSAQTEIPSATSGKWEDAADTVIANSAQWGEDTTYEAGSYVDITDNTISVTGLQPAGDYADRTALGTKLDTTAFSDVSGSFITAVNIPESANWNSTYETVSSNSAGWSSTPQIPVTGINGIKISESDNLVVFEVSADYATKSFVNSAVDSAVSGKLDSATYAAQSGDFYLTSNPAGYITNVPTSYLQNTDLTIVDNKITEISGIELSAGDEFPQSATDAIEVVTANSGDWNDVSAKLDKSDSGNFYTTANESGFATTSQLQTVSGDITGLIPTDLFTKASADTLYQPIGDYLTTGDSAEFYTTGNPSGFIKAVDMTAYIPYSAEGVELPNSKFKIDNSGQAYKMLGGETGTMTGTYNGSWMMTQYEKNSTTISNGQFPMADTVYTFQSPTAEVTALQIYYGMTTYERITGDITSFNFNKNYLTGVDIGGTVSMAVFTAGSNTPISQAAVLNYEKNSNVPYLTEAMIAASATVWNTVTSKLDTTAFSNVSGSFLTAHQELPESANWNSTYNTVHDNSASWTGGGASYTGDAQGALDEVYSNSANWNETYSAVSSNSADWNTVIDVSAGSGIVFNQVNNVVYIEADIRTGSI